MKKVVLAIIAQLMVFSATAEESNDAVIGLLVAAKATGVCGTYRQMALFQESTQMPGGDEFIVRFINTEVTRLGKTQEEFFNECRVAVDTYQSTMEVLGFDQ